MQPKPRFAVGEKVRIRQWDDMAREYGVGQLGICPTSLSCYFVFGMRDLCGKTVTITQVNPRYVSTSFEYFFAESVNGWHIEEYMLEPLKPEVSPIDVSGLITAMCDMFE